MSQRKNNLRFQLVMNKLIFINLISTVYESRVNIYDCNAETFYFLFHTPIEEVTFFSILLQEYRHPIVFKIK